MKVLPLLLAAVVLGAGATPQWEPVTLGKITHYDCEEHCGKLTRSESPYSPYSLTVAIDDRLWHELGGEWVRVTNLETGRSIIVKVNDTGHLRKAGVAADLPEGTWVLISGKPLEEGVFEGVVERWVEG